VTEIDHGGLEGDKAKPSAIADFLGDSGGIHRRNPRCGEDATFFAAGPVKSRVLMWIRLQVS
jgi:hypothetical protein